MIQIRNSGFGTEITIDYTTDLGNLKAITVTVDTATQTLNPTMPGSLNKEGRQALQDAIALGEIVLRHGIVIPHQYPPKS